MHWNRALHLVIWLLTLVALTMMFAPLVRTMYITLQEDLARRPTDHAGTSRRAA